MAAALARRASPTCSPRSDAPCYVVTEALAEQVTGFHVHRGALASLRATPAAHGRRGAGRRPVRAGPRGHRRPHQRRRDLPLAAPRWASTPCSCRRAAPTRSTAARSRSPWARCSPLPWTRLPDWYDALPDLSARGLHHRRADAGRRRGAASRRPSPGSTGSPWCWAPRATACRRAGRTPRTDAPSSRCTAGIDSLNVAAATAVACYVTRAADPGAHPTASVASDGAIRGSGIGWPRHERAAPPRRQPADGVPTPLPRPCRRWRASLGPPAFAALHPFWGGLAVLA